MLDPSMMTPQQLQAYRAMLGQIAGVPPGQTGIPGGTMASGNLPAVIPQPLNAQAAGPMGAEVAAEAPAALAGEGAAAPSAAPGLLMRLMSSPLARGAGAAGLIAHSLAHDPGTLPERPADSHAASWDPFQASYLNPSDSDTAPMEFLKSVGRGFTSDMDSMYDSLTKTRGEKKAEATAKGKDKAPESPTQTMQMNAPSIEDALGITQASTGGGSGSGGKKGGTTFGVGGQARNPLIDALEENMVNSRPRPYGGGSPELEQEFKDTAAARALSDNSYNDPRNRGLLAANAGSKEADLQYKMSQAALALSQQNKIADWADKAAKTGMDLEKENYNENGMKIHMGRGNNPTIMESTIIGEDGKPQKILRNLDDSAFGIVRGSNGQIDPHASAEIMGAKFNHLDKDPMGKPLLLLGNIQKDGQMASVLNMPEMSKAMPDLLDYAHRSLLGVGPEVPKDQVDAKILMLPKHDVHQAEQAVIRGGLLTKMQQDPQFRQKLINIQYNLHQQPGMPQPDLGHSDASAALGQAPDNGDNAPPQEGDDDFLTQLDNARSK